MLPIWLTDLELASSTVSLPIQIGRMYLHPCTEKERKAMLRCHAVQSVSLTPMSSLHSIKLNHCVLSLSLALHAIMSLPLVALCVWLCLARSSEAARSYSDKAVLRPVAPTPPQWPQAYKVEFTVSMPDMDIMQPQGFSIPVKAWYDGPAKMSRVEMFDGMDTVLVLGKTEYDVHPRIDRLKCWVFPNGKENEAVNPILPDISTWTYEGDITLSGREARIWKLEFRLGEQVSTYAFYVSATDGAPLKLHMFGRNIIESSHFDEYIYEFTAYQPLTSGSSNDVFKPPGICSEGEVIEGGHSRWLSLQVEAIMPRGGAAPAPDASLAAAYAHWSLAYGRPPAADLQQHQQRLERFKQVHDKVMAHNADPDKTYTMQLGRFADWSEAEYYGFLMPEVWRRRSGLPSLRQARREETLKTVPHAYDPLGKFKRQLSDRELPRHVDWRGTAVDAGVKDQGYCGSCWSFAAVGTMESAWYLSTGEVRSFSEQQVVDCAFDWGVDGCDGGEAEAGINFIAHSGGIALEQEYYYEGVVDYCRSSNFTRVGRFEGFLEVESRDEKALMEAVYRMGPVAVAVDASPDSFGYYKEGVYRDKRCSTTDLDHAVLLYGYGTTEEGIDFWLIKNSWSKLFGDDGFIKIERGDNDCGISTQCAIAVVDKDDRQQHAQTRWLEVAKQVSSS